MELETWEQTLGAAPLLGIAAGAIAAILLLIIVFKVHAFVALVIVSLLTAVATGIPTQFISEVLVDGFAGTIGSVALLVGFGAMLGKLVEHSGGAKALADALVRLFGEKRAPFALGIASLIMGFPMFFDAGLVMMLPIIFAVAHRVTGGKNVLAYGIPAAAAFSVMHVFLPPHPGPVTAAGEYEANIGIVLLVGLVIAIPTWLLTGHLWGKFVGRKFVLPVPTLFGGVDEDQPKNPPRVSTIILLLLLPMALIFLNTGLTTLDAAGFVDASQGWAQALILIGNSPIALLITVVVAMLVLGWRRGQKGTAVEKLVDSSLGPIASVVIITGAGGMFGAVLRTSGIGEALSETLGSWGMPVIFAAFIIAAVIRVAQGSATVALVTAAGLVGPAVLAGDFNPMQIAAITLATAAGSVFAGHVNDSGFWLVGRLMGMDVKTTLKVWTVQQTIQSVTAFLLVLVVYSLASLF